MGAVSSRMEFDSASLPPRLNAFVAQLDRVAAFEAESCGFESYRGHQYLKFAPVAQLAEATDSNPVKCQFKSDLEYQNYK
jgi:hypothetical protein